MWWRAMLCISLSSERRRFITNQRDPTKTRHSSSANKHVGWMETRFALDQRNVSGLVHSSRSVLGRFLCRQRSAIEIETFAFHRNCPHNNLDSTGFRFRFLYFYFFPHILWYLLMYLNAERISGLLNISSLVSVQLDRAEYVFLLRVMEGLSETTAFLNHQEKKFSSGDSSQSMVIGAVIPQVDVSILFPPQAATALQVCHFLSFDFSK